jgi:hypothetical protein
VKLAPKLESYLRSADPTWPEVVDAATISTGPTLFQVVTAGEAPDSATVTTPRCLLSSKLRAAVHPALLLTGAPVIFAAWLVPRERLG